MNTNNIGRVGSADGLRAFAIILIAIIHFSYHMNLPAPTINFPTLDNQIGSVIYKFISGKAYCIFSILFGFTFQLQLSNQQNKGVDFRNRFIWRMILLFMIGLLDSSFYYCEVLMLYSIIGIMIIPLRKIKTKSLLIISSICMVQPILIFKALLIVLSPGITFYQITSDPNIFYQTLTSGNLIDTLYANITQGRILFFQGALFTSNGERIFQIIGCFLLGMIISRKNLLGVGEKIKHLWRITLISFFILSVILSLSDHFIAEMYYKHPAYPFISQIVLSLSNISRSICYISVFVLIYNYSLKSYISWIEPIGKMSLTNYVLQSVIGSFLFYGWGLSLYSVCGKTICVVLAIIVVIFQLLFSSYWLKSHKRGPIEQVWHKLTWYNFDKLRFYSSTRET